MNNKNITKVIILALVASISYCANLEPQEVETAGSTIVPVSVGGATEVPVDPNHLSISLANDSLGQALVGSPFSLTLQSDLRQGGNTIAGCENPNLCRTYTCPTLTMGLSADLATGVITANGSTLVVGSYSFECRVTYTPDPTVYAERTLSFEVTEKYSEVKHDCGNLLVDPEVNENSHSNDTNLFTFSANHSKLDAAQTADIVQIGGLKDNQICDGDDNKWNLNIGTTREAYWDDGGAGAIDRDPYRFVVNHTGNYTFDVQYVNKDHPDRQALLYEKRFDPKITLYNSYYVQFYQEDKNGDFNGESFSYTLAPGTYYVVVSDLDLNNSGNADQGVYTISIKEVFPDDPILNIDTSVLTNATARVAFSQTIAFSGLTSPSFNLYSGTLPAGLTLNSTTGEISGTPTLFSYGLYTYSVEMRNIDNPFEVEYKNFSSLVFANHSCGTTTTDPEYTTENTRINESVAILLTHNNTDRGASPTNCALTANRWHLNEGVIRNASLTDNSTDDKDFYQIEIHTSGTYKFDVNDVSDSPWYTFFADPHSDYQLALVTSLEKEIKKVDAAGNGGNESLTISLVRGTYYIKVWPNWPNAVYDKSSYYSITYNKQ